MEFKDLLKEVEDKTPRDLAESAAFQSLLELLASLLMDIDRNTRRTVNVVDIVIITMVILNLITTMALYAMIVYTP